MIVLCAWCEHEGRPAFIRETEDFYSQGLKIESHGICNAHRELVYRKYIQHLQAFIEAMPLQYDFLTKDKL